MAKKIDEEKIVDQLQAVLDNHWFNPNICASIIVNQLPLYTQDRLMELMKEVIRQQAQNYPIYWAEGITSEALSLSSHLSEVIEQHEAII